MYHGNKSLDGDRFSPLLRFSGSLAPETRACVCVCVPVEWMGVLLTGHAFVVLRRTRHSTHKGGFRLALGGHCPTIL